MDVRSDVFAYDLPWGWGDIEEPLSVHIVESEEATVLLGTGDESTTEDLLPIARDHDIDVAIAEHGDIDHFGGIPALQSEFDLTVAIPEGDAHYLGDHDISYDIGLEAGETYWGIETIGVPGHTPDNLAFRYDDVLIAGDTVAGSDSAFTMEGDWPGALAPLVEDLNYDTDQMLDSIPTLLDYEYETVVTSHGGNAMTDGYGEVELLVDALP